MPLRRSPARRRSPRRRSSARHRSPARRMSPARNRAGNVSANVAAALLLTPGLNVQQVQALSALVARRRSRAQAKQPQQGLARFRTAVSKIMGMQTAVRQLNQVSAVDKNAVSAAIVKFAKPAIRDILHKYPGPGQSEKLEIEGALDKLDAVFSATASPSTIQQATDVIMEAVAQFGQLVVIVFAFAVTIYLALFHREYGVNIPLFSFHALLPFILYYMNIPRDTAYELINGTADILNSARYPMLGVTTSVVLSSVAAVLNVLNSYLQANKM